MGQSSSRSQRNGEIPTSASSINDTGATNEPSPSSRTPSTSRGNSQRPSLRKRVVSLIKPNSHRERDVAAHNVAPSASADGDGRKSWRNSRRWSKSPLKEPVVEDIERPVTPQASSSRLPSTPSRPPSDKGKSRERDDIEEKVASPAESVTELERPSTPYPSTSHSPPVRSTPVQPEASPTEARAAQQPPSSQSASSAPEATPPQQAPADQTTPAGRQFPPPGTLVVVQGIVHTTDVPRPAPSEMFGSGASLDGSSSRARGPLSRPSSFSSNSLRDSLFERSSPDTTTIPADPSPASPDLSPHSAISPGSIDVLGTLLSVAAAATAASLLTGSSDPILSSGLAPPGSPTPATPNSPASTTATNTDTTYAASRAERMRQAWSTIRERLGLRPNPPPSAPTLGSNGTHAPRAVGDNSAPQITDTRELMLAEMARAFNIGLGLNGMTAGPTNPQATTSGLDPVNEGGSVDLEGEINGAGGDMGERASGTLPPEGSFDRFLVDLQADLRVALTGQEESAEEGVANEAAGNGAGQEISPIATSTTIAVAMDNLSQPPAPTAVPPPLPPMPAPEIVAAPTPVPAVSESVVAETPAPSTLVSSLGEPIPVEEEAAPEIDPVSDSEATPRPSSPATLPIQAEEPNLSSSTEAEVEVDANAGSTSGSGGRMDAEGRINWWRLYRFPAINSPRTPGAATTAAPGSSTEGTNAEAVANPQSENTSHAPASTTPSVSSTPAVPASESVALSLPNFLPPPSGQTVVPVIVVGLQSVSPGQFGFDGIAAGHPHHHHGHTHPHPQHPVHHHHVHNHPPPTMPPSSPTYPHMPAPAQTHIPTPRISPSRSAPIASNSPPSPPPWQARRDTAFRAPQAQPASPPPRMGVAEELEVMEALMQRMERDEYGQRVLARRREEQEREEREERELREEWAQAQAAARRPEERPFGIAMELTPWDQEPGVAQRVAAARAREEGGGGGLFGNQNVSRGANWGERERLRREGYTAASGGAIRDTASREGLRESARALEALTQGLLGFTNAASASAGASGSMSAPVLHSDADDDETDSEDEDEEEAAVHDDSDEDGEEDDEEEEEEEEEESEDETDIHEMYLGYGARRSDRNARARELARQEARAEARAERAERRTAAAERRAAQEALRRVAAAARRLAERSEEQERATASAAASLANGGRWPYGVGVPTSTTGAEAAAAAMGPAVPVAVPVPGTGGARTFLIYVIGGYYPPEHSIVTGGPESFESFEALLELAEMMGHVKPPTVTKEEIEKSGLETIKPAQLAAYEEMGKIANNCTERCLICLDDYAPEDDVRVMSCRHAFHQKCVDQWLQTGRNNCPACRSTGVNAEGSATTTV